MIESHKGYTAHICFIKEDHLGVLGLALCRVFRVADLLIFLLAISQKLGLTNLLISLLALLSVVSVALVLVNLFTHLQQIAS